jgi:hypothetical protein
LIQNEWCISTSGYCYYTGDKYQFSEIEENSDWIDFENSTMDTLNANNPKLGWGYVNSEYGAGGRIAIGCNSLVIKNYSFLTSNTYLDFVNQDKYSYSDINLTNNGNTCIFVINNR